jgi:hypothetical protein
MTTFAIALSAELDRRENSCRQSAALSLRPGRESGTIEMYTATKQVSRNATARLHLQVLDAILDDVRHQFVGAIQTPVDKVDKSLPYGVE